VIEQLARELKAELVQTHTSWVLLLKDTVYKIKKPVNFGFLDYSTLEKRKVNCEKEVLLNKRLCSSIYLGVVPVSEKNGRLVLEEDSNVVDFAVKMRRIPKDSILLNKLSEISNVQMREIAKVIAEFHLSAERADEFGSIEIMKFNTDENFKQTEKYVGITIPQQVYEFIRDKTDLFYKKYEEIFEKRIKEGRIRDGHGDIRLEHIAFLKEGICIFDCIEFNDRFRCTDVINDMCFLSMELDFYGKEKLSRAYEQEYYKITEDPEFYLFLPFFKCYRAYVRGKVTSFLLDDPFVPDSQKEEIRKKAEKLFRLAYKYAQAVK